MQQANAGAERLGFALSDFVRGLRLASRLGETEIMVLIRKEEQMMRIRILIVVAFTVCVSGSVMTATAMAEELVCAKVTSGLYSDSACTTEVALGTGAFEDLLFLLAVGLLNGTAITSPLLVEATGEVLLEDTNVLGLKAVVLCSGIGLGVIESESKGLITEGLTLSGTAVSKVTLEGTGLACTNDANCPEPLLWSVKLPWEVEVVLLETDRGSFFIALALGDPGYHIECMGSLSDECTSTESASELVLEGATLLAVDSDTITTELAGLKLGSCTLGGAETAVLEGEGIISPSGGGELTASSDGISA
jgi:hypothetical protein